MIYLSIGKNCRAVSTSRCNEAGDILIIIPSASLKVQNVMKIFFQALSR